MNETSQKRALESYRKRMSERGLSRFEVLGCDSDRHLIRSLAKRLAQGPDSEQIRAAVRETLAGESRATGGILAALRRSPLSGADLDLGRRTAQARKVSL